MRLISRTYNSILTWGQNLNVAVNNCEGLLLVYQITTNWKLFILFWWKKKAKTHIWFSVYPVGFTHQTLRHRKITDIKKPIWSVWTGIMISHLTMLQISAWGLFQCEMNKTSQVIIFICYGCIYIPSICFLCLTPICSFWEHCLTEEIEIYIKQN